MKEEQKQLYYLKLKDRAIPLQFKLSDSDYQTLISNLARHNNGFVTVGLLAIIATDRIEYIINEEINKGYSKE